MKKKLLYLLHYVILLNFLFQLLYSGYMVFAVLRPKGISGPLFKAAREIPFPLMVTRRLYAIEFWIAFSGLAIYLALTEFSPLFPRKRKNEDSE